MYSSEPGAKGPNLGPDRVSADLRHLNQIELARRWSVSPRTLERWRWLKLGPAYLRLGGRIAYRVADIERYEAEHLRLTATKLPNAGGQQ